MIVSKFGGTSLKDEQAMRRCAEIVKVQGSKVVVLSATSGTTNQIKSLITLAKSDVVTDQIYEVLENIKLKHRLIATDIGGGEYLLGKLNLILDDLEQILQDYLMASAPAKSAMDDELYSFGERISIILFKEVLTQIDLRVKIVDARDFIKTQKSYSQVEPNLDLIAELTPQAIMPHLETFDVIITQGFIGSDIHGNTTTLGRGGSDYSASLIAEALEASEVQIWTDVPGVFTTDPRICPNAKSIKEINIKEVAELANFGAKVLHPSTLSPAMRNGMKIFVASSVDPSAGGTHITTQSEENSFVRALAKRDDQKILTLSSVKMVGNYGFLERIFSILAKYEVSVDLVTTSETSVALTLDGSANGCGGEYEINPEMLGELEEFCTVRVSDNLSLIAIIGNNLTFKQGLGSEIFQSLESFKLRFICHGASQYNFCFLVDKNEAQEIIQVLHQQFIEIPTLEASL
jgi:aspartate kinase